MVAKTVAETIAEQRESARAVFNAGGNLRNVAADDLYNALNYVRYQAETVDPKVTHLARNPITNSSELMDKVIGGKDKLLPREKANLMEMIQRELAPRAKELKWIPTEIASAELGAARAETELIKAGVSIGGKVELELASRLSQAFKNVGLRSLTGAVASAALIAEVVPLLHNYIDPDDQRKAINSLTATALNEQFNPNKYNNVPTSEGNIIGEASR